MKKNILLSLFALALAYGSYGFSGPSTGCTGTTLSYNDSLLLGGTWSSSNPSVATIDPSTGVATALSAGTTVITYISSMGIDTATVEIFETPPAITGTFSVCVSYATALADAMPGGFWASAEPWIASVDASSGVVHGVNAGTTTIYYINSLGSCYASAGITVNGAAAGYVLAPTSLCLGSTATVIDSLAGGTWSSSDPAIVTVASSGSSGAIITGLAIGAADITYTVPGIGGCGPSTAVATVNVTNTTDPGTIYTSSSTIVAGETEWMSSTVFGGTWSVSPASVATIDPVSGVLTGISAGVATVVYTVDGCGGPASVTYDVTVTPFTGISGHVNFGSGAYTGYVKVWLISYAAPMLEAVDSAMVYASGTSVDYRFSYEPSGDYRIKASTGDSLLGTTGYIPTYHTSDFYWSTATVLTHAATVGDINQDINMMTGTVTSGSGFVAGDVTAGANKGTTTFLPVEGMKVFIMDAATMQMIQGTTTDAAGHYTFSNLPYGTYRVFPEAINYATTPYTSITVSAANPSYSTAGFKQHTISHTITPIPVAVADVETVSSTKVVAFPNPTSGKVNIAWQVASAQKAEVTVSDITGRVVLSNTLDMSAGAGSTVTDISALVSGLYTISVKSADLNYNTKIQLQH